MEIEISQLGRAIRRWWWVPVVIGLILGLLGLGAARTISTSYTATTQLLVMSQVTGDDLVAGSSQSATYVNLATSGPILDRVILELGLGDEYEREDLEELIEVNSIGAQIIEVTVVTDDPQLSVNIANSLSRHLVTTATDLSVGELDRNLTEIEREVEVHRTRLTEIEIRLSEIDTTENADNSEIQAEIVQLERERIQTSQTLADLERTVRTFNTELITMADPLTIMDESRIPEKGEVTVSPVLLALLGVFLGGLIGAAWILWAAFSDRKVRSAEQIVSLPLLAQVRETDLSDDTSSGVAVLGARISGVAGRADASMLTFVSAREAHLASDLKSALAKADSELFSVALEADSALTDVESMRTALNATDAVIVAKLNTTSIDDLEEFAEVLASANTRVLGTVVVS